MKRVALALLLAAVIGLIGCAKKEEPKTIGGQIDQMKADAEKTAETAQEESKDVQKEAQDVITEAQEAAK